MNASRSRSFIVLGLAILLALAGFIFTRNLIDFPVYYKAGQSLINGRTDLYAPDFALGRVMDYRYPPFFLVILYLLWLLPFKVAAYLWYLLSVAQIAASVSIVRRLVQPRSLSRLSWLAVCFSIAGYFVIILHYGNAHLVAISCLFASIYLCLKRRDISAALLMALAITVKLTPGFLLLYFALKKRWKYVSLTAVFILLLNLLPALYFGIEKNHELLRTWYQHVIVNQEFHEANGPINLSLKGQLKRYLTQVDYQQRVDGDTRYPAVNLANLSPDTVELLWLIVSCAILAPTVALILWGQRRQKKDLTEEERKCRMVIEVSLMICLMLLIEPLTSKIYFIVLLLPMTVLARLAFDPLQPAQRYLKAVLFTVATLNFVLPLLPGRSIQRLLLVLGVDFYVNLLLLVSQSFALWCQIKIPVSSGAEPQRQCP